MLHKVDNKKRNIKNNINYERRVALSVGFIQDTYRNYN